MVVLERFDTDEYGTVELAQNGTSLEVTYSEDGKLITKMVRPETLVEILGEHPQLVATETSTNHYQE